LQGLALEEIGMDDFKLEEVLKAWESAANERGGEGV
jgi:hypothetical protein